MSRRYFRESKKKKRLLKHEFSDIEKNTHTNFCRLEKARIDRLAFIVSSFFFFFFFFVGRVWLPLISHCVEFGDKNMTSIYGINHVRTIKQTWNTLSFNTFHWSFLLKSNVENYKQIDRTLLISVHNGLRKKKDETEQ